MKLKHGGFTPRIAGRPSSRVQAQPLPTAFQIGLTRGKLKYLPAVEDGQQVKFGDPLAEVSTAGGVLSLPSPASGKVTLTSDDADKIKIDSSSPPNAQDDNSGVFERFKLHRVTAERVRNQLAKAGIWPFFRSSVTGAAPALDGGEAPKAIIVTSVLAEPFRARGKVILTQSWDQIILGLQFLPQIMADYGKVEIILTAVGDPVARRLYEELSGFAWIRLHALPVKYPVENPHVLQLALRKADPSYQPEESIWTIDIQGVQAIGACLHDGVPLHNRMVALGGPGLENPRHVCAAVGTPIKDLLETDDDLRNVFLLRGGLLTGEPVDPETGSVQYDDDAFFFLPIREARETLSFLRPGFNRTSYMPAFVSRFTGSRDKHISTSIRGERRPCIACGICEKVCPAGILPQVLHRYIYRELFDEVEKSGLEKCVDCNLCTYLCPSKIELQKQFAGAREQLRKEHEEAQAEAPKTG